MKARYAALPVKADACLACGACTKRCPFDIDAAANIARAAKLFHE
ncbi:MAG: 4Fe-4S binding protein [Clostridia bacterium]|nr:4Fe-4S binding protein [Clostridia bacterium]